MYKHCSLLSSYYCYRQKAKKLKTAAEENDCMCKILSTSLERPALNKTLTDRNLLLS